jgi:hypothetical protein
MILWAGWGRRIRTPANGSRVHGPTARRSPSRENRKQARQQNLLGGFPIIPFPIIQRLLRRQALIFFTTSPLHCQEEPFPDSPVRHHLLCCLPSLLFAAYWSYASLVAPRRLASDPLPATRNIPEPPDLKKISKSGGGFGFRQPPRRR